MIKYKTVRSIWQQKYKLNLETALLFKNYSYILLFQHITPLNEVDVRTVERTLNVNEDELQFNGFKVFQGNELKEFKFQFGTDINVATKTWGESSSEHP